MIDVGAIVPIRRDEAGRVVMLDQTVLPREEVYRTYETADGVAEAIRSMVIRGAPAIGVAAAMGLALGARAIPRERFAEGFAALCEHMAGTRPTAVNLFWAIDRMKRLVSGFDGSHEALLDALDAEAARVREDDIAINRAMGAHGEPLIPDGARILTHCNTGSLATAGWGTALGVVRSAVEAGKRVTVYADETRPFLQGSRLTAWECLKEGIDVTVIADNAAGHLMARGEIDLAIVGTDRTVANGDVANKIGTYQVATMCRRHDLPFYVAAPTSTLDLATPSGDAIPIEERSPDEVRTVFGHPVAPEGVKVANPAFDVTPADLVTAIITERGVARPPYAESLRAL
ncbi:MAG: S-methyl-5-thioribose-1-phosphate isomerase [Myxococcota bacterium]